jgi:hypothetical protein
VDVNVQEETKSNFTVAVLGRRKRELTIVVPERSHCRPLQYGL